MRYKPEKSLRRTLDSSDKRRLSRRQFIRATGAVALGMALASCNGSGKMQVGGDESVQLVYQDWRTDWYPALAQQLLEQFHATHANIRVFYTPDPEDLEERMLRDMQDGTASDVFQGCCTHFPTWAQKGYVLDLRPYVQADLEQETLDDWDPVQYHALALPDGRQFGLPKYHGALALYYNKDIFDSYGVPYPDDTWDHDTYAEAMKALTHDLDGDGKTDLWGSMIDVSWDRVQVHVNGWGGHLADPTDWRRSAMGETPALEAMEWIRARMWDDRTMATLMDLKNMSTRDAFASGRLAMVEDGSWSLKDILAAANFRIGVAPFPAGPARRVTLATTDGFGIYGRTKYPDAAWALVKFLVSKEAGLAMAKAHLLQPARASLVGDWASYIREEYPKQASEMDIEAFAAGQVEGYSVISETFANMADAQRIAYSAWQRIFTLGQAPVDIMRDVSRQIEQTQQGM